VARLLDYERKTIKPKGQKIDLSWLNALLTFAPCVVGALIPTHEPYEAYYVTCFLGFGFIISWQILFRFGIHRKWSLILCAVYGFPFAWAVFGITIQLLGLYG